MPSLSSLCSALQKGSSFTTKLCSLTILLRWNSPSPRRRWVEAEVKVAGLAERAETSLYQTWALCSHTPPKMVTNQH